MELRKPHVTRDIRDIVTIAPDGGGMEMQRALDVDLMLAEFDRLMKERGQTVSIHDLTYAYDTLSAWIRPEPMTRPAVIAAPCGFGKSTLMEIFVRYMVRKYPDTFGCIVIKDKREDVRKFVDAVNLDKMGTGLVFRRSQYAFSVYGYRAEEMRYGEYLSQFTEQENYPVVVMTKEMWARQSNVRNIDRFQNFRVNKRQRRRRTLLLIDERPNLVSTYEFTAANLNKLLESVRQVSFQAWSKDAPYYADFEGQVSSLRSQLEGYRDEGRMREYIAPINDLYELSTDLRRDWAAFYDGNSYDALGLFEMAVRRGGILSVRAGMARLTVSYRVFYEWGQFNNFVLDATAEQDPYYLAHDFVILVPSEEHTFDNVTFYINHQYNLSRSFFNSNEDSFDRVSDMVHECLRLSNKTMLVTYKENLPKFEALFSDEISSDRVMLKHFDSGRATNEYRDCDGAVFIGWLLKGENFYPSVASAVYEQPFDIAFETGKERGFHYLDPVVDDIRFRDMVTERVQDIHRLRPRSTEGAVRIFIFHRDEKLIAEIVSAFPGAKTVEFEPIKRLVGGETAADRLIDYFAAMEVGGRIKAKTIRDILGVHRNTFAGIEKDSRVRAAMVRFGIRKDRTFYIKEVSRDTSEGIV